MGKRRLSRRARLAVPAGALLAVGGVIAAVQLPSAQAAPALPARTAAQLIADVTQAVQTGPAPALSGTVVETAALGLPQLPDGGNPASIASLFAGTHTVNVWYANAHDYRISMPGQMSETDLYRDGSTEYLWQSAQNSVTEFTGIPAHMSGAQLPAIPAFTPQQAASEVLAAIGPTTTVSTDSNVTIAGQAAYELVLAPKESGSLIAQVRIAVDARNGIPLRVQVFAQNATSPAISVGFSSVTFGAPAHGDVSYVRSLGAHVTKVNLAGRDFDLPASGLPVAGLPAGVHVTGSGWLAVLEVPASLLNSALAQGTVPASVKGTGSETAAAQAAAAQAEAALQALLNSAMQVHGSWGTGQMVSTGLVNVLITNSTIYVGAVEPSVLYAAAAQS
jgi:hypothetical protein